MSKTRSNNPKWEKVNKNSEGQFLKRLARWFWHSRWIVPEHKVVDDKTGVETTVPVGVTRPGMTYKKDKE